MQHDSSDILGQDTMPTVNASRTGGFPLTLGQTIFTFIVLFGIYIIGLRLWKRVLLWRERSYKLATRRRHGIPDSDLRPFNVAYSEAMMRAREEEGKKQLKPRPAPRPPAPLVDKRETLPEQNLRHRSGVPQRPDAGMRSTAIPVPGGYTSGPYESHLSAQTRSANDINPAQSYMEQYNVKHTAGQFTHAPTNIARAGLIRQRGFLNVEDADALSDGEGKKRALDGEQEEEHEAKKSRVEGDELIDGDEDAEFEESAPKRGSKRGLREEEDAEDLSESKKSRGKRARKVSQEKNPQVDQSMDVDDEEADELTELKSTTRGKKRDRAEAGSTFGGDDDESADELEADDSKARRRRRKRRTVAKRKSEASYARGKKRERDGEGDLSDEGSEESSLETKSSRKKRGKRSSHVDRRDHDQASKSDISMDESTTSTKSKVRNIGDEWESNGIKYKIGPNAQRLRQALVKKARQKFVMPKDSQHPDRDANLQVCIECWLTEEEYQDAKNQHLLAWQDSPERQEPTGKLSLDTSQEAVPFPQGVPGKSLLWSTSTTSTPTRSPASHSPPAEAAPEIVKHRSYRDTYRHSIATTVGLPISPFVSSQIPTVKRIASTSRALSLSSSISGSTGLSDSTNGSPRTPHKVFSKWEKQELEAKAMMKMREATRKKELEREAKLKEERERTERAAAEKLRLERERLEREQRERAERERVAREKAEAEKKAKEAAQSAAQSAAVPQITVTAPSIGSIGQPSQSSAPAASSLPGFFSAPSGGSTSSASPFGPPKVERTPSTQPSSTPSFFSGTAQPAPASAQASSGAQAQAKPPTFSFAPAGTSGGAAPSAVKPGMFSFSNAPPLGGGEQKKAEAATTSGPGSSLLTRLGPQGGPGSEAPKAPSQPAQAPTFSFSKPEGTQNVFAQPATSAAPASGTTSTAPSSTATSTPKFNFGFPGKTATTTPATAPRVPGSAFAGGSSSLSGALGSDAQKASSTSTAGPTFGFKTPATPASAANNMSTTPNTTPGPSSTTATAPKFSFGTSAFSNQPSAQEPVKSAFGGNTNTSSAFSSTAGSGPSPFGVTPAQTQNVFGGIAGANKPADAPKPLFSFANPSSSSASTSTPATNGASSTTTSTPKPLFSFGNAPATSTPTATTTPATGPGGQFSFKFGQTESTTPQSSPFGAAASSGQSVFGGAQGVNATTTTTPQSVFGSSAFGAAPPSQQQQQ